MDVSGQIHVHSGDCVDVDPSDNVGDWYCMPNTVDDPDDHQWILQNDGKVYNPRHSKCLNLKSTDYGTQANVIPCADAIAWQFLGLVHYIFVIKGPLYTENMIPMWTWSALLVLNSILKILF